MSLSFDDDEKGSKAGGLDDDCDFLTGFEPGNSEEEVVKVVIFPLTLSK
jgi:hypothetical protein